MTPGNCIHRSLLPGGMAQLCAVGHNIRGMVGGPDLGWVTRMPCNTMSPRRGPKSDCSDFLAPTPEQLAEHEKEMEAAFVAIVAARDLIIDDGRGKGEVDCPKCGGRLYFARAASNGHISARCKTADCLSFME
jgi:hypothetical protein